MTTLVLEADPAATSVEIRDNQIVVHLSDGRLLGVPLVWYPRLLHATADEQQHWVLLGDGYAIEWPDLDEHIGIDGLLAGRRSGESEASLAHWLDTRK